MLSTNGSKRRCLYLHSTSGFIWKLGIDTYLSKPQMLRMGLESLPSHGIGMAVQMQDVRRMVPKC